MNSMPTATDAPTLLEYFAEDVAGDGPQEPIHAHATTDACLVTDAEPSSPLHVEGDTPVPQTSTVPRRPVAAVAINLIDRSTQVRNANAEVVTEYARLIEEGAEFPPIDVCLDSGANGEQTFYLVDGQHRLLAHLELGRHEILCAVRPGTLRHAKWAASASNTTHGLTRSKEDKRRQVMVLMDDAAWKRLSNQEIARHCVVSPTFVQTMRSKYQKDRGLDPDQEAPRLGKDGREHALGNRKPKTKTPEQGQLFTGEFAPEQAPSTSATAGLSVGLPLSAEIAAPPQLPLDTPSLRSEASLGTHCQDTNLASQASRTTASSDSANASPPYVDLVADVTPGEPNSMEPCGAVRVDSTGRIRVQ